MTHDPVWWAALGVVLTAFWMAIGTWWAMSERWFVRHRQDWIAETLRVFGFINREHLERKFGISTPQASYDLALYMREQPGAIMYNKSSKRYEAALSSTDGGGGS